MELQNGKLFQILFYTQHLIKEAMLPRSWRLFYCFFKRGQSDMTALLLRHQKMGEREQY